MLKKYLFSFLILISFVHSANTVEYNQSQTFVQNYKNALNFFKEKDYNKAYILLNQLFQIKNNDININFYLGRSAYETTRYDESIRAYERFLFEQPDNNPVKLEMAKAFFMNKTYKESKKLLTEVKKDTQIPETILLTVNYYLKLIEEKENKHFVNGAFIIGLNYDSNINSRSKYDTYNDVYVSSFNVYLNGLENTVEDEKAWYNQEIGLINYQYKIDDKKKIKQDFLLFNKDSFNSLYNKTDVSLISYTPALNIQHTQNLSIDYALYADLLWYGGKKTLKTIALYPQLSYKYDNKNQISASVKVQNKFFQQEENKAQDSIYSEISTTHNHIFNKQFSLRSNLTVMKEKKKDGDKLGVDYIGKKASLSLNYRYNPTLIFSPNISYSVSEYDDLKNHNNTEFQKNKLLKVALSSSFVYSPKVILQSNINYSKQNSNDITREYDKHTFTLSIIRTF